VHPIPINDAEGVFQRFFDPNRCHLDQWHFSCDDTTKGTVEQIFAFTRLSWATGKGRTVARLEKEVDVDVSLYDGFIACATLTSSSLITITLTVDGNKQIPIDKVRGTNAPEELEAPLFGRRLTHVSIVVTNESTDPGNGSLFWLGTFHDARREASRARPNPYVDAWDDLLVPAGDAIEATPQVGLFFGHEDLNAIRNKVKSGPYKALMEKLRKVARQELTKEPWRGVAMHPNDPRPRCLRVRSEEDISHAAMRSGAFVGLIDDDHELLRMAADHLMALCHCPTWQQEFQPTMPGSAWDQRPFHEYRWAHCAVFAWDWAGSCLTESGRYLVAHSLTTKALPWIQQALIQHPYIRHCNQGAYFAWGAIVCELALASRYRYAADLLDAAVKALDETVTNYFMPDGGTDEGVGYGTSTCAHAILAYIAVARHRGVALQELVPPNLAKHTNYIRTMMSTVPPYGSAIKIADGGRANVCMFEECLAGLHQLSGDDAIASLMSGMMAQDEFLGHYGTPGALFNIVLGPEELPEARVEPPVFNILENTGMLCSCRPTEAGPVRLQLTGGKANAGHSHDDRGSIIIEAFGEEIAIDRGQMPYDNPHCETIKFARYHNILIPECDGDLFPRQMNPCPGATIPEGKGDESTMEGHIDITPAWGEMVESCVRNIESDEPTSFEITDRVNFLEAKRVSFNLHSKFPWHKTGEGWITRGNKTELTVTPGWQPDEESGEEDFVDGLNEPVYHLCLVAPAAVSHALRTALRLSPVAHACR
jgi:hypothetical protein